MSLALGIFLGQLAIASLYALAGVGFVIIYRGTKVLNFAQGILALLGGYFFYTVAVTLGLSFWVALPLAVIASGVFSAIIYLLLLRSLVGVEPLRLVMLTIALSIVLTAGAQILYGSATKYFNVPFNGNFHLPFGVVLPTLDVAIIVTAVVLLVAFAIFLTRSRLGLSMRAAAADARLATYRRISVNRISALTWGFAGAGIAYGAQLGLSPSAGDVLGFAAFPAIIVGGIDSVAGVLVGSFVLAEVQGYTSAYWGGQYSTVMGYVLLLVILVIRPSGLFGSREVVRL
jgi:branched-chain amino acid transport system permease protein